MIVSRVSCCSLLVFGALAGCGAAQDQAPQVEARTAALSTAWSAERKLVPVSNGPSNARTAVNEAGVGVVVWEETLGPGLTQVQAAVREGGAWSAVAPLSDPAISAQSSAVVVDDAGSATVLFRAGGVLYETVWSAGTWSAPAPVPASPDYSVLVGLGVDAAGDAQIVTAALRTPGTVTRPATFDLQALVRSAGVWGAPLQITAAPVAVYGGLGFHMNRAGQGLAHAGLTVYRAPSLGAWGAAETIPASGGQIYTTSSALDAGGRGYFLFRSRYGGALVSTAAVGAAFSTPKAISKFTNLGSTIAVTASSADHALIYGVDYTTYKARAAATADGGKTWGGLLTVGGGTAATDLLSAAGSERGLYALSFSSDGDAMWVATGSGLGTGAAAWTKKRLALNYALGSAAIAGTEVIAGWNRGADPMISWYVVGAASGVVTP